MARNLYYPSIARTYSGTMTASQILASIETVDGAGSGLDADTVDGFIPVQQATGIGQVAGTDIKIGYDGVSKVLLTHGSSNDGAIITESTLANNKTPVAGVLYTPTEALTDAATIAWDWNAIQNAGVTLTANRILGNPTNASDGEYCALRVSRTGAFILSFGNLFKGVTGLNQSTVTSAIDHFVFRYNGTYFELVSFTSNIGV